MRDLASQLKSLKNNPEAGSISSASQEEMRGQLMKAIGHKEEETFVVVDSTVAVYSKWVFIDFISKPLAAGAAVFVLLMGGWMTTVSAASNSLPGDTLYNVKIVTERAKLKLASDEEKAILHTEFARERLDEAMELSEVDEEASRLALSAFKKEIELAGSELRKLKDSGSSMTSEIASRVDQKIEELGSALESGVNEDEVQGAQDVTEATSNEVVDVMVESHEEGATDISNSNLAQVFKADVSKITSRQTFDLGRVAMIGNALQNEELAERAGVTSDQVAAMNFSVEQATSRLSEAMNLAAAGGFRSAFVILRDIEQVLAHVENQIAETDIQISTAVSAPKEEVNTLLTNEEMEE